MHINIKRASVEDKQEVLKLCRCFYSRWLPHAYHYFENKWNRIYKQVILASLENKIVGYLAFRTPDSDKRFKDSLYISDLYVLRIYRKKGIGLKLVESAEKIKKEKGLSKIVVNVDKNSNSRRFYYKFGFKVHEKSHKSLKLIKTED